MISLLVTIVVLLLVFGVFAWIIRLIPIPPPFGNIALAVTALLFLLFLLNAVGLVGAPWIVHLR